MSSSTRPATLGDEAQVIALLARAYSVGQDEPFLEPALLRWKYFAPRDDFSGPRSFVVEKDSQIVAYVGLWPVTVQTDAGTESGLSMIDWASLPEAPGAGISLLQRLTRNYDFVYGIGGTEMTRTIFQKLGFDSSIIAATLARPLRPFRQILLHQSRNRSLPLRLVRNFWWSKTPVGARLPEWSSVPTPVPDVTALPTLAQQRDAAFFHFLETCPRARFLGFHVLHQGRLSGYFLLSDIGYQVRIAGAWLEKSTVDNWRALFQLAQQAALRHTTAPELTIVTTSQEARVAAKPAGMRWRGECPVYLFRKRRGAPPLPLQFQMVDNDTSFLRGAKPGFVT